ncbi:MAG: hypothetical protein II972_02860 [Elusimicrobiaceae bacterium]|nr:hypothetical protein [Elusimicrobiaceae bacterium]
MKSNLKFLLTLSGVKLVMLNNGEQNICYFRQNESGLTKDLSKIATLLQSR